MIDFIVLVLVVVFMALLAKFATKMVLNHMESEDESDDINCPQEDPKKVAINDMADEYDKTYLSLDKYYKNN